MNDLWQNKIVPIISNPVLALHGLFFLVLNVGLLKVFTAIINERKREIEADLRLLASELSLVIFVTALVAGAMAAVYKIQGTARPAAGDDESLMQGVRRRLNDPFFLLDFGIYAVAYLALIATFLLMIELKGLGPVAVWSWWATQMFYGLAGVLILIAVRALVNALGSNGAASAATTRTQAAATDAAETGDEAGESTTTASSGPLQRLVSNLATYKQQLHIGLLALAYLGAIFFVLDMWAWRNFTPNGIWWTFFYELALVVGTVGFVLLLIRLVEVASHSHTRDVVGDDQPMVARTFNGLRQPGMAAAMVFVAVAVPICAWALMNIWESRNQDVLDFWAEVTWSLHTVVPAVAFPLVLWSLWKVAMAPSGQLPKTLLYDPYRLMTLAIYLTAYLGMIDFVFHGWIYRDQGPAWIWDGVTEDLFNVIARVGVFVMLRAIVAAGVAAANPAAASSAATTPEPEPA